MSTWGNTKLTPTQVAQYIKSMLDRDRMMSAVTVQGELSNHKIYGPGHHYFTLKDGESALKGVMFLREAKSLRFRPENGMQVVCTGRVTVYPRDGQYQLYCEKMEPDGIGDLYLAYEQLKERLRQQGLFDSRHKQPLPRIPRRVALITSPSGAAVRDMIRILNTRWPMTEVFVVPVRVQGQGAANEIAAAIGWANRHRVADLLIVGRGGGSLEDLWAFNEEVVAYAIHRSQIPTISAVGHEPDVALSDFVADRRASTPSNAAELCVPDQNECRQYLTQLGVRMEQAIRRRLSIGGQRLHPLQVRMEQVFVGMVNQNRQKVHLLGTRRVLTDPKAYFQDKWVLLEHQQKRLEGGMGLTMQRNRQRLTRLAATLDAISPLKVLGRGYAIAQTEQGEILSRVSQVEKGMPFTLRLSDGQVDCQVQD